MKVWDKFLESPELERLRSDELLRWRQRLRRREYHASRAFRLFQQKLLADVAVLEWQRYLARAQELKLQL